MANPRGGVAFDGIGSETATYKTDASTIVYDSTKANGAASTMIGKAVSLSADDTVQLASDGEAIEGVLLSVEADDKCTVQNDGFVTLPGGSGASLTRGKKIVGALGAASAKGYIREVATGTAAELGVARGRIVRSGTATAVVVDL